MNPHLREGDSKDGGSTVGKKGKKNAAAAALSDAANSLGDANAIEEEAKDGEVENEDGAEEGKNEEDIAE